MTTKTKPPADIEPNLWAGQHHADHGPRLSHPDVADLPRAWRLPHVFSIVKFEYAAALGSEAVDANLRTLCTVGIGVFKADPDVTDSGFGSRLLEALRLRAEAHPEERARLVQLDMILGRHVNDLPDFAWRLRRRLAEDAAR